MRYQVLIDIGLLEINESDRRIAFLIILNINAQQVSAEINNICCESGVLKVIVFCLISDFLVKM
ncbi:hypothetical protein C0W34_15235 [Photobacterium angustum]|uniref:Uncharacterized protein n=1 Tax=Photobacterium angustum TaxID=661 RepID=A0A855SHW5_PHOAN|nr:hypothetical protein UB35_15325 [Photobacterium angustum]PSX08131.1 hypothetical protein C0W41_08965 [Photobacterium angustum]PSX40078.1 hypothetical protein C0W34_15235 [Photobacterium angustum]